LNDEFLVTTMPQSISKNSTQSPGFDIDSIRRDFPILDQQVKGKPLVFLDSAASSQKPTAVIQAVSDYYNRDHSNVHRGVHTLSERATDAFEKARFNAMRFINAMSIEEVIFVRGATEGINLVANCAGEAFVKSGDCVLVTEMEHHANIVPWQMLCDRKGAKLLVATMDDAGELDRQVFRQQLEQGPTIVAMTQVSNALGTVNPVKELTKEAHDAGALVLIDGAQAAPHSIVDVQDIDCDFYVFSGHKMYGPTGQGILYGRRELLEKMPPWQGGGEMIREVTFTHTEYNVLPFKFEAGTPDIAGAIGLSCAMEYMWSIGIENIAAHETDLLEYANLMAAERPWFKIIGTAAQKAGVLSFEIEGVHANDTGMLLDAEGVAVRTGHHCAMPVMQHYGIAGTARASLGVYNTRQDIDALFNAADKVKRLFS
jgi:cysteine desulfurase/selenocysteine lyase